MNAAKPAALARVTSVARVVAGVLLLVGAGCKGCKKPDDAKTAPDAGTTRSAPRENWDELSTGLGIARALDAGLAPTNAQWSRNLVLDQRRGLLGGEAAGEAVALVTDDAGRTWRSYRHELPGWSTFTMGADGSVLLALGTREKPAKAPPAGQFAPIDQASFLFAGPDATALTTPTIVFPPRDRLGDPRGPQSKRPPTEKPRIGLGTTVPFLFPRQFGGLLVDEGRKASLVYGGLPGVDPPPPVVFPPREKPLPIAVGRPPLVLSVSGKDLLLRRAPEPGMPLDAPLKIAGLVMSAPVEKELARPPACEHGTFSFHRVSQQLGPRDPGRTYVLGLSPLKVALVQLPDNLKKETRVGCGGDKILVEVVDPPRTPADSPTETVVLCNLEGRCQKPLKPPFRYWPEPHTHELWTVATARGAVLVMASKAGDRWGLYLTHSLDGGKFFELPRVIGEGRGDRGKMELGGLFAFGDRVVLLLEGAVPGTSRRGWYVTISEDGGATWYPP